MIDKFTTSRTMIERRTFTGPYADIASFLKVISDDGWKAWAVRYENDTEKINVAAERAMPDPRSTLATKWRAEAKQLDSKVGLAMTDRIFYRQEAETLRRCADELDGAK